MPKWTKEQHEAIHYRDQALLVAAAAGSGKTAVLVERILTMITGEDPVDVDRLLVVTFTKAAAAEMRERIGIRIAKAMEENPEDLNLVRQMTLLNQASIMTIDKFCKRILDENFHLVDLDPGYSILGDNEARMIAEETMDQVLEAAYAEADPDFLTMADTFSGKRNDDQDLVDLVDRIYRFSRSGTDPKAWIRKAASGYERLAASEDWFPAVLKEGREVAQEAQIHRQGAMDLADSEPVYEGSKFLANLKAEGQGLDRLLEELEKVSNYEGLQKAFQGVELAGRAPNTPKGAGEIGDLVKASRNAYKASLEAFRDEWLGQPQAVVNDLIAKMAKPLQTLGEFTCRYYDALQEAKRRLNKLDFADMELFALSILMKEGQPTEIARQVRQRYEEILIDEYQDSNDLQEAILTAVSRNGRNIFMVGDVKQSIYRFRQAKPAIFLDKYRRFLLEPEEGGPGRKIQLYRNFRSRPEVLQAVNRIFSLVMSEDAGELDYTEEESLIFGAAFTDRPQPVQVHLLDETVTEELTEEEADLKGTELEAKFIALKIKDMINSGTTMVKDGDQERPLRYRDIVILMRSASRAAPIYQKALEEVAVPYFSDTGSSYFETLEIRTMLALLRVIDNPFQDIPLLTLLRSPFFSFTEDELILLRGLAPRRLFYFCLQAAAAGEGQIAQDLRDKCQNFLDSIATWRQDVLHSSLAEFIWRLYQETAYLEYVGAMPNGLQRQANLRILFHRAAEYEKTVFSGLYQFIRYIDHLKATSNEFSDARIIGESEDVVRLMTIHKSKGLEFPVVFLANAGKGINRQDLKRDVLLHESLGMATKHMDMEGQTKEVTIPYLLLKAKQNRETVAEEMRLLYVAMTRAKEYLIITASCKSLEKALAKWQALADQDRRQVAEILKSESYLDWIMPGVLSRDDGLFQWEVVSRQEVSDEEDRLEEVTQEAFWQGEIFRDENLHRVLTYAYPHLEATRLPSKVSVSYLKKSAMEEDQVQVEPLEPEVIARPSQELVKPKFLKEVQLTGADRGTAFHDTMFHIDPQVSDLPGVVKTLEDLVARDLLLEAEAQVVDPLEVLGFLESDLGRRFKAAHERGDLFREEAFYQAIPAKLLKKDWESEDPINLNGIIDAFFLEGDDLILLDYKTDRVGDNPEEVLLSRYQLQIRLYAQALQAILGRRVKEAYLYSTKARQVVRVPLA